MKSRLSIRKENKDLVYCCIALLCCTVIFAAIELKYPYFFLRDDNADSYIAIYVYAMRCISEGKFPFYCFNAICGERFFASGQTGILNPLIYLAASASSLICGNISMMMDILAYLSILIGSLGAFLLLRKLGCSYLSSVIGSIAWSFNCYNIWEGDSWIIIIYTTSVFPFFLLTGLRLLEDSSKILNIILAVIPRAYLFFLGHPQFFVYAAIFDCIFVGMMCLTDERKKRLRALLVLIKDYAIMYVSTFVLILPLFVSEYEYTQCSLSYGSASTYDSMFKEMTVDVPAFFIPYLYNGDCHNYFYPPFIGFLLFVCLIAGLVLVLLIFAAKDYSDFKPMGRRLLATLPCLIIGFLILFSHGALKVISFIPVLNRFQFYHRLTIFFTSFEVIFACLSMTVIGSIIKNRMRLSRRAISWSCLAITLIEVCAFSLLYVTTPHMGRGPEYETGRLYDQAFADRFTDGRYVVIGSDASKVTGKKFSDMSENLGYNLTKLYGLNNVSGYFYYTNSENVLIYNECFLHMLIVKGSIYEYYPGLIEQMREQSVVWYVVNPESLDEFEPYFTGYGLECVDVTENSVIYCDHSAQPFAYDKGGNEISLVQDVNSLYLTTDESFAGGEVTMNYTYDPNFVCFIDGRPAPITDDPEHWQFKVDCPAGAHDIEVRYVEPSFSVCSVITCGYIVFAGVGIAVYTQARKKKAKAAGGQ